ncbi:MAG: electron transport complex subunit E [Bacteroidales bacterium]|nr:electron transport complex subunit E [Bacteroidales bacterium]
MKASDIIKNGLIKENPTWVLVLGMCPTLATTTSALNGLCMGLATTFVLIMSNIVISLLKSVVPDKVRIPCFIVVIATFVTIVQMVMQGFLPSLYESLGLFIPLIVVNCIVLGRAEAFASKNNVWHSLLDGLFMGLGFTWALTLLGIVREALGAGTIGAGTKFCFSFIGGADGMLLFILAPGGFICLGLLMALINHLRKAIK